MKDKESYYAIIPADVRYCNKLVPNAKLLYGEITALCNKEGFCWATNGYFAKLYNVDKMTISRWIQSLEENGFIKCRVKNRNIRRIYLGGDRQNSIGGYTKKYRRDIRKSISLTNTTVNNTNNTVVRKRDDGKLNPSFGKCQSNNGHNPFDINCTNRLIKILQAKRKIMRRVNEKSWICQFQKLRVDDEVKKRRIKEVLIWYGQHIGEKYMIEAYSAKTFRDRFDDIANKMNQAQDPKRKKNYKPGDPEDNFKTETTSWITKDGKKRSRVIIDES